MKFQVFYFYKLFLHPVLVPVLVFLCPLETWSGAKPAVIYRSPIGSTFSKVRPLSLPDSNPFIPPPSSQWKKQFEDEFSKPAKDIVFSTLKKGIFFHQWERQLPFWEQLENPDPISNIEDFLNYYYQIIIDEIRVSLFHKNLNTIRSIDFLNSYLQFVDTNTQWNKSKKDSQHPLTTFIINGNLNGIIDFMKNRELSHIEKLLVFITGLHSRQFDDQILNFLDLLQLDINQTVKVKDFRGFAFSYLHPSAVVTSLGYEFIASSSPELIEQLLEKTSFNHNIKNFLLENPLHFFIRSGKFQNRETKSYSQSVNLLLNRFFGLSRKKDLFSFSPLMMAAQLQDKVFIDEASLHSLSNSPQQEQTYHIDLWANRVSPIEQINQNFLAKKSLWTEKDRYGRSLIDISFENNHIDLAYEIRKIIDQLSVKLKESLYEERARQKKPLFPNQLAYIRISPVLLYYIEGYESLMRHPDTVIFDQEAGQTLQEIKNDVMDKVDRWELARQKILADLLKQPLFFSIYSAIQKHSKKAMENLDAKAKQSLTLAFALKQDHSSSLKKEPSKAMDLTQDVSTSSSDAFFVLHFLNEAIILNSLPAVEYLLENHFTKKWFQLFIETNVGGYKTMIDPLSLALFAYLAVPEEERERKSKAEQIVRSVAAVQNPNFRPNAAIHSSPIEWAIALGLLDMLQFFHEEKGIEIPETVTIGLNQRAVEFNLPVLTEINSFFKLSNYIDSKLDNEHSCYEFIN